MNLIKNFLKLSLNIGNKAQTQNNTNSAFEGLTSIMNNSQTLNALFESKIDQ